MHIANCLRKKPLQCSMALYHQTASGRKALVLDVQLFLNCFIFIFLFTEFQ